MMSKSCLEDSAKLYETELLKGWEALNLKKSRYLYDCFKRFFKGSNVLELGCADGIMTQWLCEDFESVTAVDGSEIFIEKAKAKLNRSDVTFKYSMFEEFMPGEKFDIIIMSNILEHVDKPVELLEKSKNWLTSNGRLIVAVPNANALNRLVGVKLGMLPTKDSFNELDVMWGHKRVYTCELLTEHVTQAGFSIEHLGGTMVKPLSNRQIATSWSEDLIDAFLELGEDLPDIASEIYLILKL
jgi:2-polyprenyl-3-methyl-5-hydroxy-6-metoxy-1,4-benzoquinol methylase